MRFPEERLKKIWEDERTAGASGAITTALRLLSLPYGAAVALRNRLYDGGVLKQEKLPCPVISVGNLTAGGTGKTPTVILLAALLKEHGYRPAVLSRGYGGHAKAFVNVVSDGNRILLGWREAGDEPVLIAGALPGVPVLTGPKRSLTGKAAVERFGADILILDDAFQHRSLFRDIDIVLIDAARPFGNGLLLPRGPLREPPQALRRAGIILRTGDADREEPLGEVSPRPSFRGIHRPRELVDAATGRVSTPAALQGQEVFAFAGIGFPDAFRRGLTALGAKVVSFQAFPDHHPYGRSDIEALRRLAAKSGAARIVTTEKDGVRLADFPDFRAEISLLRIGMEIIPAEPFAELIFSRLASEKGGDGGRQLKVRGGKRFPGKGIERVLIRGTNWIGDVVMTLPAVAAIRKRWPRARISVLAKPWVAEVYRLSPDVDEVIVFEEPGRHGGIGGKLRLAGELRGIGFDCAILLQNAIEAAIIALLAGIPLRAGYNSDGRGLLLTHAVRRTQAIRRVHQIDYYLEMVRALCCTPAGRDVRLRPAADYEAIAEQLCGELGIESGRPWVGIAPGAAYGPAKRWFPDRFAAVADRLISESGAQAILFGSGGDRETTAAVQKSARHPLIDIAGKTDLKEAIALIARCALFISNDSGLMHVAGALGIPTIAVFGSTNPVTTSPVGEKSMVIHHDVPCGPCLKPVCPTDFRCMEMIGVEEVYAAARKLLDDSGSVYSPFPVAGGRN